MDILDQFIMGSANTPSDVLKIYQQLNLSMCSINTVEIPKACTSYVFWNVFEHCLRHYNMIVLGVYKRREDQTRLLGEELWAADKSKSTQGSSSSQKRGSSSATGATNAADDSTGGAKGYNSQPGKPYVWLYPPKNIELSPNDELFVLSDRNLMDWLKDDDEAGRQLVDSSKLIKNEEKKTQEKIVNDMRDLDKKLTELNQASKEWERDV